MVRKVTADGFAYHEPPYTKAEWLKMWDSAGPPIAVGSNRPRMTEPPPAAEPQPPAKRPRAPRRGTSH
jgi:hypothetical protein